MGFGQVGRVTRSGLWVPGVVHRSARIFANSLSQGFYCDLPEPVAL